MRKIGIFIKIVIISIKEPNQKNKNINQPLGNKLEMGQQTSFEQNSQNISLRPNLSNDRKEFGQQLFSNEGILKVSCNPFPNSILIRQTLEGELIYVQKYKTLSEQINKRKSRNQYFSQEQILNLIQSLIYTLGSLEKQGINYKDISSNNVFFVKPRKKSQSHFENIKILPNSLICQTTYQKLLKFALNSKNSQNQKIGECFVFSPEMIIAFRAKEKQFTDDCLLKKSSVFSLGILFLSAITLKNSQQFYDTQTFDILGEQIQKGLSQGLIRYDQLTVRLIANMIDFDFQQRIQSFYSLTEWLIYELKASNKSKAINQISEEQRNLIHTNYENQHIYTENISRKKQAETQRIGHQQEQTLPICLEKKQVKRRHSQAQSIAKINNNIIKLQQESKDKIKYRKSEQQNNKIKDKILIKSKQVTVYLQKNIHPQNDKQNISRLIYSPFLNGFKQNPYIETKKIAYHKFLNTQNKVLTQLLTKRNLAFQNDKNVKKITLGHQYLDLRNNLSTKRYRGD